MSQASSGNSCDECESQVASIWCSSCNQRLCGADTDDCDAAVHSAKAKKHHQRIPWKPPSPLISPSPAAKPTVCDVCDGPANIW
jgi:hypothetical protein